ncbi:SusD/RagB family nutrient-binding outer membrane lipoprotein [Negadavirga shengliensis]|uniref:SusD/RagB family nutrient-binding outer membrane lipoprotein n=1 Tax=Negadavirga shengliensis TaxID=1389218 RepID=A0ABV9SXC9_9BACT
MKNLAIRFKIIYLSIVLAFAIGCSEDIMDQIDANPNAPEDVSINLLLPQVIMNAVRTVSGSTTIFGVSTYVEHSANVRINPIDPWDVSESHWSSCYYGLNDLEFMIGKAEEESNFDYLAIGQILYAYVLSNLTDLYGDIPMSEAVKGSEFRTPRFDSQEMVYSYLFTLLDDAIENLERQSVGNPGNTDMIFGGDMEMWRKTAYGLKARFHNRLSNIDPEGSANAALAALPNSFYSSEEGFGFNRYQQESSVYNNPWSAFQNSQELFAVGKTLVDLMESFSGDLMNDPRAHTSFSLVDGEVVGAPTGANLADPSHNRYSQPSRSQMLYNGAPQPILQYDELKFIEAEAYFRLQNREAAFEAFQAGIRATLQKNKVNEEEIEAYLLLPGMPESSEELTLEHIIGQKYIAFWLYQPLEAFNDFRRTGIPEMSNPNGTPLRIPYPISEVNRNPNTPTEINDVTIFTTPVWWAKRN